MRRYFFKELAPLTNFVFLSRGVILRDDPLARKVSFRADQDDRHSLVLSFAVDCVEPLLDGFERALLSDTVAD